MSPASVAGAGLLRAGSRSGTCGRYNPRRLWKPSKHQSPELGDNMSTAFDPTAFKSTTRAQWEAAASAWHEWGPVIEDWLAAATATMLDDALVTGGSRVLDIAAGAGGQ